MPAGLKNRGFLDPRTCWKEWHVGAGSLGAVQDKFLKDGLINNKTNSVPTKSGIEKAAFAFAIEHQDEARKDLAYAWEKEGHILTDADWKQFLKDAARLVYYQRPRRLQEFLTRNGL